jgi:hypothetical protein
MNPTAECYKEYIVSIQNAIKEAARLLVYISPPYLFSVIVFAYWAKVPMFDTLLYALFVMALIPILFVYFAVIDRK